MQWRFLVACQILFSLTVLVLCAFLPGTPRWLAKHGRKDEARPVIGRLLDVPDDHQEVEGQLSEILDNIAAEHTGEETGWSEVISNGSKTRNLQRVLLGMAPYMMNQWSVSYLSWYPSRLAHVMSIIQSNTLSGTVQCISVPTLRHSFRDPSQ